MKTGVCLDPTYTGKALYHLAQHIGKDHSQWKGKHVLFVHTGGLLSLFDWTTQLLSGPLNGKSDKVLRFNVDSNGEGFTQRII